MAPVAGQGTIWNLPNYAGELLTADAEATPFLSMIGGLNGGVQTSSATFPCSSTYDYAAAAQPQITETQSLTASTYANEGVRAQVFNVCQIFMQSIYLSYEKLAGQGYMSGLNTAGQINSVSDELAWQIQYNLKKIARDVELSFLTGTYALAGTAAQYNATRGISTATSTTYVNASSTDLSKALIDQALRTMAAGGAQFSNVVIFCNAFQKQMLSDIYGFAPMDRNVGGVNISTLETDFGRFGVVYDRFVTASILLFIDVAHCRPVFQPVPGKGNFFVEPLAKTGASENYQLFGKLGLDYGAEWLHGQIYGLTTS